MLCKIKEWEIKFHTALITEINFTGGTHLLIWVDLINLGLIKFACLEVLLMGNFMEICLKTNQLAGGDLKSPRLRMSQVHILSLRVVRYEHI